MTEDSIRERAYWLFRQSEEDEQAQADFDEMERGEGEDYCLLLFEKDAEGDADPTHVISITHDQGHVQAVLFSYHGEELPEDIAGTWLDAQQVAGLVKFLSAPSEKALNLYNETE